MSFIVNNTTIINPLDLIAPHSCRGCGRLGEPLCDCCKINIIKHKQNVCPKCKSKKKSPTCSKCKDLPPIYTLGIREGLLASLIHDYKYNSNRAIAACLADLLDKTLPDFKKGTFLVPLPTATHHIRARALDHMTKVSRTLAKKRRVKSIKLLTRAKNTVQVGSTRESRLTQAKEAYSVNPRIKVDPTATYILLDDVWTTGASLLAATKKLREAGALKVEIIVLAISN